MRFRKYLPSPQLASLFVSLAIAGGLIVAAQAITKPEQGGGASIATTTNSAQALQHDNWEAALYEIQAQQGSSTLPTPPDSNTVDGLRQAAQSENMTDTISRTLLVNLTNAKAQGLGDDIPTQNQLIDQAIAQTHKTQPSKTYRLSDLSIVPDSPNAKHAYGNTLATTLTKNSSNNVRDTFNAIDTATSQNDPKQLAPLKSIEENYRQLILTLVTIPVPQTLAPFHLQMVNDFVQIADTYPNMESILVDPVQGLTSFQQYHLLGEQTYNVFINIAQAFNKNGILFTKDEPGALWSALLSSQ